jgi:hypothetical protein
MNQTLRRLPRRASTRALQALASLKLTVVLFTLSLILVFFGTLAQIDGGLWTSVRDYFRSFYIWIPFQLAVQFLRIFFPWTLPEDVKLPGAFPFPGGWTLGGLLLTNLLAAHLTRFRFSWKRAGVLVLHAGLILMITGELVSALCAVEGHMAIAEGQTTNVVVHDRESEVVLTDHTGSEVEVIPASMLRAGTVPSERLPITIKLVRWVVNSRIRTTGHGKRNPATQGDGPAVELVEAGEIAGAAARLGVDTPGYYLEITNKEGTSLGVYALSIHLRPQVIEVAGHHYGVTLRFKQTTRPYALRLLKFQLERYPGSDKPKNFSSRVLLIDPELKEEREVVVTMNAPLRHRGETFYQAGWDEDTERGTVFQVVRNPGWMMPYLSCALVTLGMCLHFAMKLTSFLRRRAT